MSPFFNSAIIAMVITGLVCLINGLILLINSYTKNQKRQKENRGWTLSIIGTLITVCFSYVLVRALIQESTGGDDFLIYSWFFVFFFFPLVVIILFVFGVFFLVTSITSLQEGYRKDENGKRDVASIVVGYTLIVLLLVTIFSIVMFVISAFASFLEGLLRNSPNRSSSSEQFKSLINYFLVIIRK